MWRWVSRSDGGAGSALTGITSATAIAVTGVLALGVLTGSPAHAQAARGVTVEIVEMPDRFVAGAAPETVTVVATKSTGGGCVKVRWSMLLRVRGLELEQIRVDRVEQTGSFPIDVVNQGNTARVTDERLDPGTLCRNRTVTARYRLNVANDVRAGQLTVRAEAYGVDARLLAGDGATRSIVGPSGLPEAPDDEPTAAPTPSAAATTADGDGDGDGDGGAPADGSVEPGVDVDADGLSGPPTGRSAAAAGRQRGVPLAWFLVGGLLVFLGFSMLLNLRWRHREARWASGWRIAGHRGERGSPAAAPARPAPARVDHYRPR